MHPNTQLGIHYSNDFDTLTAANIFTTFTTDKPPQIHSLRILSHTIKTHYLDSCHKCQSDSGNKRQIVKSWWREQTTFYTPTNDTNDYVDENCLIVLQSVFLTPMLIWQTDHDMQLVREIPHKRKSGTKT